jgi:hypothetical protein
VRILGVLRRWSHCAVELISKPLSSCGRGRGAGKTAMVKRYVRNEFWSAQEPTIGAAFFAHTTKWKERTDVKVR